MQLAVTFIPFIMQEYSEVAGNWGILGVYDDEKHIFIDSSTGCTYSEDNVVKYRIWRNKTNEKIKN